MNYNISNVQVEMILNLNDIFFVDMREYNQGVEGFNLQLAWKVQALRLLPILFTLWSLGSMTQKISQNTQDCLV